jgi:hypothetical protein
MVFQWSLALGDQRLTMSKNLKTSLHWNMSINRSPCNDNEIVLGMHYHHNMEIQMGTN